MATGSGKTRTVIALCKVLLEQGWIKNILFLADRNSLVTQAKRSFVNLLPDLSVTNLCEEKDNYTAHGVFSTYQTMMNCIDSIHDEEGKLFTCGHFDLVICDEAHRSIYNKYKDIFSYFDAPLIGLTATPKDEIDKNTYEIFELENGVPTYGYELAQAVKDGYLVDFVSVETTLKFIDQGIVYDELSEEEKEEYENKFTDENGELPESINSSALNDWVFNEDKAEYYVRQHQDNEAIAKLKSNQPLTSEDIKNLENIMWSEIGTKQDYEAEYGEKPLGEFVREIVGLDMTAAKEAFAEYLDETNLDSRQIYFVNQIVEFIVHNGMMKDLSVLQEPPFTDQGSIVEVFTDLSVWMGIRKAIEQVNANALAA